MTDRGAKAVILDPDKNVLIVRRSKTHPYAPLTNDLPGGKVEDDETMPQGLIREIKEEIGVEVPTELVKLVGEYKADNYFGKTYEIELYEVMLSARPDVILSFEHDKYEWISLQEAEIVDELFEGMLMSYKKTRSQ